MIKHYYLSILFVTVFLTGNLLAQIPEGYYDGTEGQVGTELETTLRNIINNGFDGVSYGDCRYILDDSDADPNNPGNVILVYLGTSVSGEWDAGNTWNREHVWPQSLLGVSASNSTTNAASDLHNLKPANPSENSSRGNDFYDNVATADSYVPRDEVKGDLARILFYMITMYDNLELVNELPDTYEMAKFDVLLEWHEQDPVDDFELNRNEVIYSHQFNRNPFIDHPEFVSAIWGGTSISKYTVDDTRIYPNPASDVVKISNSEALVSVSVLNIIGKEVLKVKNGSNSIDVSQLPKGQYIIVLNGVSETKAFPLIKIN